MTPSTQNATLIILEGPDGSGKTTLGKQLASELGATYVHLGPLPGVKHLARIYQEAMLPALLGYQPVVMDRAWFSEEPYAAVFRHGRLRHDYVLDNMLERVARRCRVAVVYCQADEERLTKSFLDRKGEEYLDRVDQVLEVSRRYQTRLAPAATDLPVVPYDYTKNTSHDVVAALLAVFGRQRPHPLGIRSAGNLAGKVLLVGDEFTAPIDADPLLQHPFVSFTRAGCSYWLTKQLLDAGIDTSQLAWVNQDQGEAALSQLLELASKAEHVVALGAKAKSTLEQAGSSARLLELHWVSHPQHAKRFKHRETYPLIPLLKDLLK